MKTNESILDHPQPSLDPAVWQSSHGNNFELTPEAEQKISRAVEWVQSQYSFSSLSVYIIGSICSNSWSDQSDIDIDFCAKDATKDDNDEEVVKQFGWDFKKNFIENYMEKFPEDAKIGTHPLEVYFSTNPFQCFMSVGCYNFIERKWEVGPEMKDAKFDPVSKYYADAMKQVEKILKDIRTKIFEIYELAFTGKTSKNVSFQRHQAKEIFKKLEKASSLLKTMKNVRSNFQKPAKSKEEALKRRKDKMQHIVDAAFKFLDKFGYMSILKDLVSMYDKANDGEKIADMQVFDIVLQSVKDNMSLKHLQDADDQKFVERLQEANQVLNESFGNLVKLSMIAAMMAIPNVLPAAQLSKELAKAKRQDKSMTLNSPATKKAISNASVKNEMIGQMSKTNVVNAIAQVLWKEARGVKEGTAGRKAVASVILNRSGNDPTCIVDVLKEKGAFSCLKKYTGGWTDKTYRWYLPYDELKSNPSNKEIWDECNSLALQLVNKTFKSTIGNRNSYLNKATADKDAVDSWGKSCDLQVGSHHFGYLKEHDPKIVKPGTMVTWKEINAKAKPVVVVVKGGDTLEKIAKDNNTTVRKILALNSSIKDKNAINIGQKIRVA